MDKYRKLKPEDAQRLKAWWATLDEHRGDRAQLRRASQPDDILMTPAFSQFLQSMPGYWGVAPGRQGISISDAAFVAAVLARVKKTEEKNSFARTMALPKEPGGKAVMSELRFQQLQKSRSPEEFFTRICRALALAEGKANIASLADDCLHWLYEFRYGPASKPLDRLMVRWASDYYHTFKD
ncbi:type I-E CRISPR-associated protein Cse2/CasB [Endozoicomonas sp. SESOKO1]|uniref:type I-E CRISPR-associated protein Cse2/CasB n=1 Tax=Endozoicomonas sp. SESOKO1 TaxID=2828742 RepID=UPI0021477BBB|nr:type I-E CRISPR-associated protein Cse2/CasB [Endozoicomonas sp. SESOKO1]